MTRETLPTSLPELFALREIAGSFPGALFVLDHDLRFVLAGGERLEDTGFGAARLEGRIFSECFPAPICAAVEPSFRCALGGTRTSVDVELEGSTYRTEIAPLRQGDRIVGVVAVATDVTSRVAAERQLHELNAELETILTHAPIGLALVGLDGRWLRVNDRVCEIVGRSREDLLDSTFAAITHPDDLEADLDNVRALLAGEIPSYGMEKRYFHADGHVIWVWLSVGLIRNAGGEPLRFVSQIEDITARKRAEGYLEAERAVSEALAGVPTVAEAWTRVLGAVSGAMGWDQAEAWLVEDDTLACAGIWSADEGLEAFAADTRKIRLGRGEGLPGRVWQEAAPIWIEDARVEPSFVRAERAREVGLTTAIGIPLVSDGKIIGILGFLSRRPRKPDPELLEVIVRLGRQIGSFFARRRAEEQQQALELRLLEAQRRESLGVLAGGIAHDFNNLLVGVLGNASLLASELPAGSSAAELVEQIELAAGRAAGLTRQMLDFSGRGEFVLADVDLGAGLAETARLVRSTLPAGTELAIELGADLPLVQGDASQLGQLMLNLLTNAAEALPGGRGRVTARTSALDADRALLDGFRFGDELEEGRYVLLEVSDDGDGMTDDVLERIFEPYYTTKFTGRGLGLAASIGVVRGHNGALRVTSAPGSGTEFAILLPALAAPPSRGEHEPPPASRRETGVVLVVDDEEIIRSLAAKALERAGHSVLTAPGGAEAPALASEQRGRIDCVLLDLTMPGMSGEDVLATLRSEHPEVAVLLSSGYTPATVPAGAAGFLQKPYTMDELLGAVAGSLSLLRRAPR